MKIAVVQYMIGNFAYFKYSEAINRHYCGLHGYEYVLLNQPQTQKRHVNWAKIEAMKHFMKGDQNDYVLFMDADAHFYGMSLKIEHELIAKLESLPDKDILLAEDILCESRRSGVGLPNSGVILLKVNDFTRAFYEEWDAASELNEAWKWQWYYQGYALADQAALRHVLYPKYENRIFMTKEYYLMNAIYGQYIRHYAGIHGEERLRRIQECWRLYQCDFHGGDE